MGTIFILASGSTTSLEEVAAATPNARRWFQVYIRKDKLANYESTSNKDKSSATQDGKLKTKVLVQGVSYYSLTWEDLKWLKSSTRLPIILKGILTADDAELAVQHGASAVFVSNHGGRQLDTVLPTIDVLPEIVKQVDGRCEIYLYSGVRTGSDVFKALALGAKMVFLGRAVLWGLTCGGESGAKKILEIIKGELDLTLALSGVASIGDLQANYLCRHLKSSL